jgi:hypothetical protein
MPLSRDIRALGACIHPIVIGGIRELQQLVDEVADPPCALGQQYAAGSNSGAAGFSHLVLESIGAQRGYN